MNFFKLVVLALFCNGLASCSAPSNKFSDPINTKIADFQDKRQTDSLIRYLLNRNPIYRIESAKALASVQDSAASMQLGTMLLEDPNPEARRAAAFALGQTPGTASPNALIPALQDREPLVLKEILEGLGKTVQSYDLQNLKNFKATDSIGQEGQSWGFYYVGTRGLADAAIVSKQMEFLNSTYSLQTRLGAAHFFNRALKLELSHADGLLNAASNDRSAYVRMAATSGLRKLDSAKSIPVLLSIAKSDVDYRVRISAVRSLSSWATSQTMTAIVQALSDANHQVGVAASEVVKPMSNFRDAIHQATQSAGNNRIKSNLYKVLLSISPTDELINEIRKLYQSSTNDYEKASLLISLSTTTKSYEFIAEQLLHSSSFVIKTSAAQALVNISQNSGFDQSLKAKFAQIYREAILIGDSGVIGIISAALTNPEGGFKEILSNFDFLLEAKKKLVLPKDIEALQPLEEAIAYFEGKKKPLGLKNQFNHPINWDLVKSISKEQRVKIETTKGVIVLKLLIEEAPGSVGNFVDLVNKNYFDGKYFHRFVPNFVIQTGCNRGDGFGSEDYSIRSEFSMRRYQEGSVGMASAGKDTEGTQWFITHSPTPHLNGRYTIFAEVTEGMGVLHSIEVGDKIQSTSLF